MLDAFQIGWHAYGDKIWDKRALTIPFQYYHDLIVLFFGEYWVIILTSAKTLEFSTSILVWFVVDLCLFGDFKFFP